MPDNRVKVDGDSYAPITIGNDNAVKSVVHIGSQDDLLVDWQTLYIQLENLRKILRAEAQTTQQDESVLAVGKAAEAVQAQDRNAALGHLKKAGEWALDFATKIGASVAAELIKKAITP